MTEEKTQPETKAPKKRRKKTGKEKGPLDKLFKLVEKLELKTKTKVFYISPHAYGTWKRPS